MALFRDKTHPFAHSEVCQPATLSSDHNHVHVDISTADGERRVYLAMILTGGFMLLEVAGGIWSGSLALLADAGHMLGDFVALTLSWTAFRLGRKSPDLRRSFGYHRFQVLAAFVNALAMLLVAVGIVCFAVIRFFEPPEILAGPMLGVAITGLLVNIIVYRLLVSGAHTNLNVRGAALHVFGDMLGSIAAIAASIIILSTGWLQADPLLSLLAAILILRSGYHIVRQSGHILLEGTPEEVDPAQVSEQLMARIPELRNVHHVHIWSLTDERPVLTLHAQVTHTSEHDRIMNEIHRALESLFGVSHATVQLEYGPCPDDDKHQS